MEGAGAGRRELLGRHRSPRLEAGHHHAGGPQPGGAFAGAEPALLEKPLLRLAGLAGRVRELGDVLDQAPLPQQLEEAHDARPRRAGERVGHPLGVAAAVEQRQHLTHEEADVLAVELEGAQIGTQHDARGGGGDAGGGAEADSGHGSRSERKPGRRSQVFRV